MSVAPQVKVDGPGVAYPGICGRPAEFVGRGRTHRVDGVGVVNLADTEPPPGGDGRQNWVNGFDTVIRYVRSVCTHHPVLATEQRLLGT